MTKSPSAVSTTRTRGAMTRRAGGGGPQPYDFRRPIKLSREHVRTLQIAFETYARSGSTLLTTRLRTVSNMNLLAIEQLTYEEYVASLNNPTVLAAVTVEPLAGSILFEISLATAMAAIDHMLGGPGGPQPERPLTDIELPLLRGLLDRLLDEMRYAFEQLVDIHPKLGVIEYNPQFVRSHSPGDAVVVASFELKVGQEECVASICLPFASILPVLEAEGGEAVLSEKEQAARRSARRNVTAGLSAAPLDVAVRFQPIRMRTDDIVQLRPGDVVPLGHPVSRPLAVTVNDTTFAQAVPGNQGSRLACLIVPSPTEENRR
ncbi:flagellar motor switch protein FliM [Micromonospora sp. NPDC049679]|uniref:flagellar motor switch protein FliM n=1 Tax=Micromonospora sp. NPDC049679 TaxID=3155920 RepID=UPI0033CEAC85